MFDRSLRRPNVKASRRAGATTVEFAVALPIFFLIILFFFETWRFQQFQQAVDQATLEASRVAILPGATVQDATQAGRVILDAVGAHSATINITPNPILATTDEVTVSTSVSNQDVGLFFRYFSQSASLSSSLTLPTESARIGRIK
jgi:Flp pilus assembly protein TadG